MDNEGDWVKKPKVGMTFNSEDEAYDFYNNYGGAMGFGVRRSSVHRSKDDNKVIIWRKFVCNKEGTRGKDKRDTEVMKHRAETITNCLAKMCVARLTDGMYECKNFIEEHNHELHTAATTHFLRSKRAISNIDAIAIDLADGSGIKPKQTFDYLGLQAGGGENLGFTREDLKNYLRTKRKFNLDVGEIESLTEYFQSQCRLNPSFTFSTQLDSDGQVTNIFWANPKMLVDYACFGDVVSFDTTFCPNKECRPLGIFAGFNHHRGAVIFGAALLYDETTECDSVQGFDLAVNNIEMFTNQIRSLEVNEGPTEASVKCMEVNIGIALKKKERQKGQGKRKKGWVDKIRRKKPNKSKVQKEVVLSQTPFTSTTPNEFQECTQPGSYMSLLMGVPSSQASASTPSLSTSGYSLGASQASGSMPYFYSDYML